MASATEELSTSAGEIGRQVTQASRIASHAVAEAKRTDSQVEALAAGARPVGDVVTLISGIASLDQPSGRRRAGTAEVTENIARVKEASVSTGAAATQVLGAAGDLARQAEQLTGEVASFLASVKAALGGIHSA